MARPMRRAGALLCIVAIGLAGCGEEDDEATDRGQPLSKRAYERALVKTFLASGRADLLYNDLVYERAPQPQCERWMREFQDVIQRSVNDLNAIPAPIKAQQLQDDLVAGVEEALTELEQVAVQVEAGELRCGLPLQERLSDISTTRADRALAVLRNRGYVPFGE